MEGSAEDEKQRIRKDHSSEVSFLSCLIFIFLFIFIFLYIFLYL